MPLYHKNTSFHYLSGWVWGRGVGVLDETKANSAPNLVGVGAGAELGNMFFLSFSGGGWVF